MTIFDQAESLQEEIQFVKNEGVKIGFVPTMGALHDGHLSLLRKAKKECKYSVASIFINPTQFNNSDDLANYPRTLEQDLELLQDIDTDLVFVPSEQEIYPDAASRSEVPPVDLGRLDQVMEGAHRPGHFRGVMQIVKRLFEIVQPDVAYFGEKDFQQLAVIRKMVQDLRLSVKIVGCPTFRESDGLAMSSRNVRLTRFERVDAPIIARELFRIRDNWRNLTVADAKAEAIRRMEDETRIKVEYLEIADESTLEPVTDWNASPRLRVFVAAHIGDVRLIDNVEVITEVG